MYFVRAARNKTRVMLPAYQGHEEALAMQKHLIGFGWLTKVIDVQPRKKFVWVDGTKKK